MPPPSRRARPIAPVVALVGALLGALGSSCPPKSPNTPTTTTTTTGQVRIIALNPTTATLGVGQTLTVGATVSGDAGVDQTLIWSSSNTAVASVDQTGKVTAVGPGNASITATSKATPAVTAIAAITVLTPIDLTPLFGTYNISATKASDTGCAFAQTFTGQLQVSANKDGSAAVLRLIERLTREYRGALATSGSYSGTGSGDLSGFAYNGSISGTIGSSGTTISGQETLNFTTGCPGRVVVYQFTGTK